MVQPYAVLEIPLGTARSFTSLGSLNLPDGTLLSNWIAKSLTITSFPSGAALSIALGDRNTVPNSAYGLLTGSSGFRLDGIPFTQIYFMNIAQVGLTAELVLAWID